MKTVENHWFRVRYSGVRNEEKHSLTHRGDQTQMSAWLAAGIRAEFIGALTFILPTRLDAF